jgi:hypothetical protein
MDAVQFLFTASAVTQTSKPVTPGEVMKVVIQETTGTPALTLAIVTTTPDGLTITETLMSLTSADGAYTPVTRMQTEGGANLSGAGEFVRFVIPPGSVITAAVDGTWTGSVVIAVR